MFSSSSFWLANEICVGDGVGVGVGDGVGVGVSVGDGVGVCSTTSSTKSPSF